MRAFRKAGFALTASAAALGGTVLSTPVRAIEAPASDAAPTQALASGTIVAAAPAAPAKAAPTTVAQGEVLVAEAIEYEQGTGFYATIGLGGAWPNNIDGSVNRRTKRDQDVEFKMTGGFALDAGVGYDFGPVRAELTYIYNRNGVDDISYRKNWEAVKTSGGNQNGFMGSAYWDISTGTRFTPYIGAGVGYINQNWGDNKIVKKVPGPNPSIKTKGGNIGLFGWQAKAGVAYGVNWNTDIYAEAVYQGAESFTAGRTNWSALDNNWGFKIGARYRFGGPVVEEVVEETVITPAPAPAPRPQPAPAPVFQPEPAPIRGLW